MAKSSGSTISSILRVMIIFTIATIFLLIVFFIILQFTIRGEIVEVPSVIGKSFVDATQILNKHDLSTPRIEGEKYSGEIPKGYVVDQRPRPGSKVKKGRQVKVFLSKGAEAGIVPRIIGKTITSAQIDLNTRGLEIGLIVRIHSDDFPQEGTIIAHTPPPYSAVQKGTRVSLLVSLGPYYRQLTMPDISGMKLNKAIEFLKSRGFRLGTVSKQISDEVYEADVILEQDPQPGARVKSGAIVNVIVSSITE